MEIPHECNEKLYYVNSVSMSDSEALFDPFSEGLFNDGEVSSDLEAELYSRLYYSEFNDTQTDCQEPSLLERKSSNRNIVKTILEIDDRIQVESEVKVNLDETLNRKSKASPPQDWLVIGKNFDRKKVLLERSKPNQRIKMTDSSECEIIMEVLPFKKPSPNISVVELSESSVDEDINSSEQNQSKQKLIEENFTLNVIDSLVVQEDLNYDNIHELTKVKLNKKHYLKIESPLSNNIGTSTSFKSKGVKRKAAEIMNVADSEEIFSFNTPTDPRSHTNFKSVLQHKVDTDGNKSMQVSKDLWTIIYQDKFRSNFQQTPYYKEKSRLNRLSCNNCRECGHISRFCSKPQRKINCYLCGQVDHSGDNCLNPICTSCLRYGHTAKHCLWSSDDLKYLCSICNTGGHLREECPDMWRRYYLSTQSDHITRSRTDKYPVKKFCCNCGKKGHTAETCSSKTMDSGMVISSLEVCSYTNPNTYIKSFSKIGTSKYDKVCSGLFNKKNELASLANEKFHRAVNINNSYKRSRTKSDDPRSHNRQFFTNNSSRNNHSDQELEVESQNNRIKKNKKLKYLVAAKRKVKMDKKRFRESINETKSRSSKSNPQSDNSGNKIPSKSRRRLKQKKRLQK